MDGARQRGWIRRIPNVLSLARIAAALVFPLFGPTGRLVLVVAAAFTDWLDGYLARRIGAESAIGGLLDAVADKLLVLAVLVTLAVEGTLEWWQVPLVLTRDFVVLGVSVYVAARRSWGAFLTMPARLSGKVTTALLFAFFLAILLPLSDPWPLVLFVLAAASSLAAAADYLWRFVLASRGA